MTRNDLVTMYRSDPSLRRYDGQLQQFIGNPAGAIAAGIFMGMVLLGATDLIHHTDSQLSTLILASFPQVPHIHNQIHHIAHAALNQHALKSTLDQIADMTLSSTVDKCKEKSSEIARKLKISEDEVRLALNIASIVTQ